MLSQGQAACLCLPPITKAAVRQQWRLCLLQEQKQGILSAVEQAWSGLLLRLQVKKQNARTSTSA